MKKLIILTLALSLVIAGIAVATVVSSKHDLRLDAAYTSANSSQVCLFCHHPHRGSSSATTDLLWNISDAVKDYPTYASASANAVGMGGNLGKTGTAVSSLLCMGCHDGATSNTFIKKDWADAAAMTETPDDFVSPGGYADLDETLADDHPVDFTYPTVNQVGNDIQARAGNGQYVNGFYSGVNYPTFGGTMQCATCHNVHNGESPLVQFMRGTGSANDIITDSVICRDCHTSK